MVIVAGSGCLRLGEGELYLSWWFLCCCELTRF